MAETVAERIQDLVLASLFLVIAVVALVKCRRVIVLEGAEVRSCMRACVVDWIDGVGGWMVGVAALVTAVGIAPPRACSTPQPNPPTHTHPNPHPYLTRTGGHQGLLLPHLRGRRAPEHLVLHPLGRAGAELRPRGSLGVSDAGAFI